MTSSKPPAHSPTDIQSHLYTSFLEARTADVALHVHGSWEAIYKLHRVVLIQAGFFRSLFTAGFLESSPRLNSHHLGPHEVTVVFDDPNITRAAFEICVARLYGGGPPLYVSPALVPTSKQPLTPPFSSSATSFPTPAGHHPCSPRFLLSLLATSIYLSIPSIASQSLSLILSSVGPLTVVRYLGFAIGKGIGETEDSELESALGLEHVGQIVKSESETPSLSLPKADHASHDSPPDFSNLNIAHKEDPAESDSSSDSTSDDHNHDDNSPEPEPSYYYGLVSDKIGEAAACWLTRWGQDMLAYEEQADSPTTPWLSIPDPSRRRATLATTPRAGTVPAPGPSRAFVLPTIWRRGGLDAKWVSAVISSDVFFVKNERERYDIAKRVVEMRRVNGLDDAEEKVWVDMFKYGIYYSNMSLEDLLMISQDVSLTTKRPYVSMQDLQSAHWNQSLFRHQITARSSSFPSSSLSPSRSPPPQGKELGIPVMTADILSYISSDLWNTEDEKEKPYFPVPVDSSLLIGDNVIAEGSSMDTLFELPCRSPDAKRASRASTSEANFFGILSNRQTAASCIRADNTGKSRWSPHPPYRFAVEFWGVSALKEKSRLHSHTIWYAGSLFNVYVQVVRKKGVQLGVYLHRQSSVDPIPPPSVPRLEVSVLSSPILSEGRAHGQGTSFPHNSMQTSSSAPSIHYSSSGLPIPPVSRANTPISSPISTHFPSSPPTNTRTTPPPTTTSLVLAPAQPYRDPRPAVSAYFTITCASATGSSMTRFSSAPDVFSISQSWGWKSSSLRTEEYLDVTDGSAADNAHTQAPDTRDVSLRATVVLGIV